MTTGIIQYDCEVTKSQVAAILRKANIIRFKKVAGGQSVLRDVKSNHSYTNGVEIQEIATYYNVHSSNMRPKFVKSTTGKFRLSFVDCLGEQKFSNEEIQSIMQNAIDALVANGFVVVDDFGGYTVAKLVA